MTASVVDCSSDIRILSDQLPADLQSKLDPEYLQNERTFLALRDSLLRDHINEWVAVANGQIVSVGNDLMRVLRESSSASEHAFVALVGRENVEFKVRRTEFLYDQTYQPFAIPTVTANFSDFYKASTSQLENVIADTGADLSLLPETDCQAFDLLRSPRIPIFSRGVIGPSASAIAYRGHVQIGDIEVDALIQPVIGGRERIIGRDVLNQRQVLFDGPSRTLVFEP